MTKKSYIKLLGLLLVVGLLFAAAPVGQAQAATTTVACTGSGDSALLQAAITGATDGDTINVTGTCVLDSNITVSKAVTLDGNSKAAKIQVSGTGYRITMTTAGATLKGFEIEKTDKTGVQDIIWINASNITIENNKVHGQFVIGDGEVSRAIVISGGNSGLLITGNEFYGLRQPAYISGLTTGTISNNYTHGTKGWVVEQGDMTFTGNTWGAGADANVFDIAILGTVSSEYYTNIPAMSAANNNAFIEDQRYSPARLTPVYVNASAPACGSDCGTARAPYNKIQDGIARVIPGGTVNVAAGTYDEENILITKGLTLQGAGATNTFIAPTAVTNNSTVVVQNPSGNVTISGFNFVMQPKPSYGSAVVVTGTGIAVDSVTVTISNNVVTGSNDGAKADYGFYGQGNNAKIVITGNTINKTGDNPIVMEQQFGSTTVENNTFYITASPDYDAYYSMVYSGNTISTPQIVQNNVFHLDHSGSGYSQAISFTTAVLNAWGGQPNDTGHYTNIQIKDNTIYTEGPSARGIGLIDRSSALGNGTITGAVVTGNKIIGEAAADAETYGITLVGDIQGAVIQNNEISNVNLGFRVRKNLDSGTTLICSSGTDFSLNKVTSVTIAAQNTDCTGVTVDASPNWWGNAAGPGASQISGPVDFTPWCADAACTEFLPVAVTIAPVDPVVCGNTTTTTIDINVAGIPASIPLQGYQFRLHFDKTKTSIANLATDIVNGGFVANGGFLVVNYIDETTGAIVPGPTGIIDVAYTQFTPSTSTGNGKLASVKLTHLGIAGDIVLSLTDVLLSDRDGFPIPSEASATATTLSLTPAVLNVTQNLGYCSLAEAVAGAASSGDVLQLQADIAIPATVTVDKALTLDLNGKVATGAVGVTVLQVTTNGALTIEDALDGGTIRAVGSVYAINVNGGGSLVVNDGAIQGEYGSAKVEAGSSMTLAGGDIGGSLGTIKYSGIGVYGSGATLTVTSGTIQSYDFGIWGNGSAGYGGTIINIGGGSVTGESLGIYHPQAGTLNISGGTITGPQAVEMRSGTLNVTGGTIHATGDFVATAVLDLKDGYSTDTGDAIFVGTSSGAYAGNIVVNISGDPTITSNNGYALREAVKGVTATNTDSIYVTGGTFTGGVGTDKAGAAVSFSSELVAIPRVMPEGTTPASGLLLTGGLYNTDPAAPIVYVFVPYGTIAEGSMYRIVGISLNVHDFYYANYDTGHGILRGVSTDFYATNFVFADATSVTVQLFSGTEGAYVLQQTNTLKNPLNHPGDVLTSSFDIFGTYVSNSWTNVKVLPEYGQHVPPTRVLVTVVLPGGTLTGENLTPDFEYSLIDPVLVAEDFAYMAQSDVRGVTAGFHPVNFTLDQVLTLKVELFAGTQLLQTNISPVPSVHGVALLQQFSGPFDIFGTFDYEHDFASDGVTPYWNNTRELEYGQTLVPTRVLATVTLPGGVTRTVENVLLTGDRTSILPGVNGLITLQGILTPKAGVPVRLTSGSVVRDTLSTALSDINYGFTGVETLTYTFTTHQPRYLNVTADSGKTFLVNGDKVLNSLRLYGGDVNQDNIIELLDASAVGTAWGSTVDSAANINYDGIVNIQDLALVGGNYGLISTTAYNVWSPLP